MGNHGLLRLAVGYKRRVATSLYIGRVAKERGCEGYKGMRKEKEKKI